MTTLERLQEVFRDIIPPNGASQWRGYSDLLQYLTVDEINKLTKKGLLESNQAEYDSAEPSYRIKNR